MYEFGIREGRGQEVYTLESLGVAGVEVPLNVTGADLALYSFQGLTTFPRFDRREGMEEADVLDTSVSFVKQVNVWFQKAWVEPLSSLFRGNSKIDDLTLLRFHRWTALASPSTAAIKPKQQADINIFTVASGLLYEVRPDEGLNWPICSS